MATSDPKDKAPAPAPVAVDSSVVMKGLDAKTFSDMEAFVKDLEKRPNERLFRDLKQFAELSSAKFSLVSYVLVNRYKHATAEDKELMRKVVKETADTLAPGESHERITGILSRLRP